MRYLLPLLALLLPHLFATTPDPLYFEPNLGQSGPLTRFVARTRGAASLIQDDGIVLRRGVSEVRLTWEDTDPNARWMHPEAGPGVTSYIRGNRADHWIHNISHYSRVTRVGVYPGTDLILYGSEGRLEFDFVLAPGAAPERIQFTLSGLDGLAIDSNGDLAAGTFLQRKPRVYQNGREIEARYRLIAPNRVAFELGTYDPGAPLTIDPVLESATLLGGSGDDRIIAADPSNRIVGTTTSTDFPGLDSGGRQGTDIFVYDPVKQSTVIVGGSGDDIVTCAIIGPPGYQVTIAGYTNSRDFPVTTFASSNGSPQPLQPTYGGGDWDGFLLTLSGAFPIFGTYVGGSGDDRVLSLGANYYDYFAVGGSTTSTDFPLAAAWQSRPGGGVDGFLQLIQVFQGLMLSTYLGGSGDDRVTALTTSTSGQDLWLAGETRSADWQPPGVWSGVLNGPSDGFLLHAIVNSTLPQAQPAAGIYLGGSADDRVTALALLPNGNLAAAGVTSSTDLPVAHALQSAYGGGESDGFLAQFSPDLKTLLSATYLGGSGAEEPLALATNNFNEVLAGGWTTSPDFPVTAGLESSCGRGAQDGFLAHFDTSGQSIFATCYGGKGNDRVTAVGSDSAQHDFIAGYSESVDLPLQNAVQPLNAGSNDGFYASFTTAFIHANDLSVGRDLAGSIAVSLGDSTNYVGVTLIATSADPSSVLLAVRPDEPGQTAITLAKGVVSNFGNRNFLAYCLTDAALVPVTLSAPGYATRTINVRCVPSGLVINRTDVAAGAGTSITVVPSAIDPDTHLVLATQNPRGGLDPIHVAVSNPAPDLINFSTASATADQFTTLPLSLPFTMKAAGSADVAFSSNSAIPFVPGNVVHIHGNPLQFTGMSILRGARDLMVPVYLLFPAFPPNATFPVTLTSSDPSKVLISPTSVQHGQPTLTNGTYSGPGSVVAWLEILDTGPVTITATSPGMDPVTAPVAIGELAVGFFYPINGSQPIQNYSLGLNQSVDFGLRLYVYPIDIVFFQDPRVQRPGVAPVTVQVQSTNPQAIVPDYSGPFPLTLAANETLYHIGLTAAKTGTSVLSVLGISGKIRSSSLTVQSFGPGITLSPITLGKDMMLSIYPSIIGSFPNGISLKLTSADPSKVVFSTDVTKVGQGSITTSTTPIIIQGLADSGVVEITAEILNGGGTSKTTVTLTPSGFAWYPPAWSPSSSSGFFPSVFAYALDPVTLVPLVSQGLRPGLSGSVDLQVADSSVVSASPLSLPLATLSTSSGVTIRSAAGGDTQIAIVQPPGFVQPTGRGPLRLHLPSPLLNSSFPAVGRNLEASASIQFGNPFSSAVTATPPITVTSGDSSRLLLSLNSSIPGSASVVSNFRNGNYVPVYLQALDGPVDVPVTLSADGAKDVTAVVQILPSGISLQTPDYPYTSLTASTQQNPITINAISGAIIDRNTFAAQVIRPGLDVIPLTVISSNPSVATVPSNPILNSLTSQTTVTIKPIAPGETDLTVVPPPGFSAPPASKTLHVTLTGSSFVMSDLTIGRDLQAGTSINVKNGFGQIPNDVDVTLTSGDPAKVLLSTSPTAAGSGTLTIHFNRGNSPSAFIYVQALDQSGRVPISISAPGYQDSTANITLAPLAFLTDQPALSNAVRWNLRVTAIPLGTNFFNLNEQFRPGFPGLSMTVTSSNTSVATVSPQTLTWTAGVSSLDLTVVGVASGTAQLSFSVPDPYIAPPAVPVTVTGGTLSVSGSPLLLGKDLVDRMTFNGDNFFQQSVKVTVTTGDSSRVLVSATPTALGQPSIDITTVPGGQQPQFYVHAFADSGTVKLTLSAAGYKSAEATVQLGQAEVVLVNNGQSNGTLTPLSAPVTFSARLQTHLANSSGQALRPGAQPVNVPLTLSDSSVGTLTPPALTFNPGDTAQNFTFQPKAPGSTLLTLGVPSGFADPISSRQQLFTVVPARASFSTSLSVGKDLVRSTFMTLGSTVGQTVSVTITSSDPSRLLLGASLNPAGAASITVTFATGANTSSPFSLIGLAGSGTASLSVSGAPISLTTSTVTLQPTGFVFSQPSTSGAVNSSIALTVMSCMLNPQTLAPDTSMALRSGAGPISIKITSSNESVVPAPPAFSYFAGDTQERVFVTAPATGLTTLTIQAPAGYTTPSSSNTTSLTIR